MALPNEDTIVVSTNSLLTRCWLQIEQLKNGTLFVNEVNLLEFAFEIARYLAKNYRESNDLHQKLNMGSAALIACTGARRVSGLWRVDEPALEHYTLLINICEELFKESTQEELEAAVVHSYQYIQSHQLTRFPFVLD